MAMENTDMRAVAEAVLARLFIELEASGRHVHVTEQQAQQLFGHKLTPKRPLSQPGSILQTNESRWLGQKAALKM